MNHRKIKTICITGAMAALAMLVLTSCGLLQPLMSNKEMEKRLQELYGEEFVVVSSKSFPTNDAFRAKVYVVSPKDEPDFTFYAFNFIEGETGGVPGVKRSLIETYAEKKIQTKFDEYAAAAGIEYTSEYFIRLSNKKVASENSADYYTNVVNTFTVTPETLDEISYKLSEVLNKILEEDIFSEDMATRCYFKFYYYINEEKQNYHYTSLFANGWDSQKERFKPVDISQEGIKKMITG